MLLTLVSLMTGTDMVLILLCSLRIVNDMTIRKALKEDIPGIAVLYDEIHQAEEEGRVVIGWERGVYPTAATAMKAYEAGELFAGEVDGRIVAAAIINTHQVDVYAEGKWRYSAPDDQVMVLHTLVVSPQFSGKGCGTAFVRFYEEFAASHGCRFLRMDTNERNLRARAMYRKLGYSEAGIVPTVFNGIEGVNLVLLEKKLS